MPSHPTTPTTPAAPTPAAGARRPSPRLVPAVVVGAALVVVGLAAGWALSRDDSTPPTPPAASTLAGQAPGAETAGTSDNGDASSQAAAAYPEVVVPAGSKECGRVGAGPLAAAGTANETTSCPFTLNVHEAYLASGLNGTPGQVTAYSPVTEKWYTLDCSGWQPVLCTGGVAARVILFGGELVVTGTTG